MNDVIYSRSMETLYLTQGEEKIISSIASSLTKDLLIKPETLSYTDTPERRAFRFQMLRVQDPQLVRFREQALQALSEEKFVDLAKTIDLNTVDNRDLTQIVFALGPDVMTMIITGILQGVTSQEDMELIIAFSALRHGMLESFAEASLARS